ncbi:alpha/beta hydrolase [Azohydromonas caseinilytica]|uniref:Alpha/beta hydrolase n=1 Tax=Azohydromonas caseinilytica TaxID=2728836 RepID=A0A848FAJ5_9BURK|nr:alpha/beta hydrolase [Azohydromonas caseinilytica]NML15230.1 alpha/beta hydrolase [Azohydromonas caseinilytica]
MARQPERAPARPVRRCRPDRRVARAIAALLGVAALAVLLHSLLFLAVEFAAFETPPPGTPRPEALGVPSQRFTFASADRVLHASWVPAADPRAPALLVFHGDEEEISRWAAVQARLHAAGIASLVFDYSGYGASSGRPTLARLRQDGVAAWERFVALTPRARRRVALGFSLGSAVLLDAAPRLQPAPQGLVLGAPFASAREMAVTTGLVPHWLARLLPDLWNNEEQIARIGLPLLIVHGRDDELIPVRDALRLCRAARAPRRLVLVDDLPHDAPLEPARSAGFWAPVVAWVRGEEAATATSAAGSGCVG